MIIRYMAITVQMGLSKPSNSFISTGPAIAFQTAATLYYIFKEPLFWLSAIALFALGTTLSQHTAFAIFRKKNIFGPGLLALLLVLMLTLTAVLAATGGSLPPRAVNNLADLMTCCLLALFFLAGIKKGVEWAHFTTLGLTPLARTALPVVLLMASVNYQEAWKSVFSGYFYHAVLTDRDRQLRYAEAQHRKTDTILPYDEALREKISQVFPHGVFETVNTILLEKPSLLYFYDGVQIQDPYYLKFYGLDSILVKKK